MQNEVYHSAGNMKTFREIAPKTSTHSDVLAVDKETLQSIVKRPLWPNGNMVKYRQHVVLYYDKKHKRKF